MVCQSSRSGTRILISKASKLFAHSSDNDNVLNDNSLYFTMSFVWLYPIFAVGRYGKPNQPCPLLLVLITFTRPFQAYSEPIVLDNHNL